MPLGIGPLTPSGASPFRLLATDSRFWKTSTIFPLRTSESLHPARGKESKPIQSSYGKRTEESKSNQFSKTSESRRLLPRGAPTETCALRAGVDPGHRHRNSAGEAA